MTSLPRLLLLLTFTHILVDAFASLIHPLWPDIQRSMGLKDGAIEIAYVLWSAATSLVQLPLGYLGDRFHGRWMVWLGPFAAVVCLSCIGLVDTLWALIVLLMIGGAGVAAFHPEAAALAGSCAPGNPSRALSIFAIGGYLGQAAGPVYSGRLTTVMGMSGLAWSLTWGLAAVALVALGLRRVPSTRRRSPGDPSLSTSILRTRWKSIALLLAVGVLRVAPAMGVPLALSYMVHARGGTNFDASVPQSVFLATVGAGGLACSLLIHSRHERTILWLLPLVASAVLCLCPTAGPAALVLWLILVGLSHGAAMPVLIGYGQRLLPNGERVANSITMGVSWGLAGGVVAVIMAVANRADRPGDSLYVFAALGALSSALCRWLPKVEA